MNTRELAEFLRTDVESINAGEPPLSADMIETYLREYKERVCREQRELIWSRIGRVIEDESFSDEQCNKICSAFPDAPPLRI
jgi:hypothetical protein